MTIVKKLSTEWSASGDNVDPGDTKRDDGWAVGERPPAQWFNFLENERDKMLNSLADAATHARGGHPPGIDITKIGRRNQLNSYEQWAMPWHTNDAVITAFAGGVSSSAIGWDSSKNCPVMFLTSPDNDDDLKAVDCWDYTQVVNSQPYTVSYSPGFTADYTDANKPIVACDGFLYMLLKNSTNNYWYLQKYAIADWTGTPLFSVPWITNVDQVDAKITDMCEVTDGVSGKLGIMIVGDDNEVHVKTIGKDGTSAASISWSSGTWFDCEHYLRSDGSYIYGVAYVVSGETAPGYVVRADVALSSITVTDWGDATQRAYDMICLGGNRTLLVCGPLSGAGGSECELQIFTGSAFSGPWNLTSQVYGKVAGLGFDGTNIYLFYCVGTGSGSPVPAFVYSSINAAALAYYDAGGSANPIFVEDTVFNWIELPTASMDFDVSTLNQYYYLTEFDGRDMWVMYANEASPHLFRITAIGSRHTPAQIRS